MTPAQLRAFACVARLGSVKAAAAELEVSEAAVSMHVAHLRKELDDDLFRRASAGLAFTPGGLRLASRAVEILGLQQRTAQEVSQAGRGRRVLRVATSSMFAERAAPGLFELFGNRATDLEVELSVRPTSALPDLLAARAADVTIGPARRDAPASVVRCEFLRYEVVAVARAGHALAGRPATPETLRRQRWCLGPSAVDADGLVPDLLHRIGVPERSMEVFQSDAAAVEETRRGDGICLTVRFGVAGELASGDLVLLGGHGLRATGVWAASAPPAHAQTPAAAELLRFVTTPRATQAMLRGAGVHRGRFKPAVHVTLWS